MAAISPTITTGPFTGDGVNRVFPADFTVASPDELQVQVGSILISPLLYVVTLNAANVPTVTFATAPIAGASVYLISAPDFTQDATFETEGAYSLATVNQIQRRNAIRANWLAKMLAEVGVAALGLSKYYTTRAAGAAALAVGQIFTSDETGTLAFYKVTSGAPFYVFLSNVVPASTTAATTGVTVTASETIATNAFVNTYNSSGSLRVRNANASDPLKFANGFVLAGIASGQPGVVTRTGYNPVTVVTPAPEVWLSDSVPGGWTTTFPTAAGSILQILGPADPGAGIFFTRQDPELLS